MVLIVNVRGSVAGLVATNPVSGDGLLPLPISALPQAPQFTWKIWLQHPTLGTICYHDGRFSRKLVLTF
jgi:hypothetical protein